MSRRTRFCLTLCSLSAAVGLSCYRSGSDSVSSRSPATSSAAARASGDADLEAGSATTPAATNAKSEDQTSPEAVDADEVLKTALARAADEQKRVLVHLGAPG